mgnify:FL=1
MYVKVAVIAILFILVVAFNAKVRYIQVVDNEAVTKAKIEVDSLNRQLQEMSSCDYTDV